MPTEIEQLKQEILTLKLAVKHLTEAAAVMTENNDRASKFIEEIRKLGVDDGGQGEDREE